MRRFDRDRYRVIQWATGNQGCNVIGMIASPQRPHLELVGLTQSLHSAQSVPVTFTFQTAGPTTLNVPVQEYTAQRTTTAAPTS